MALCMSGTRIVAPQISAPMALFSFELDNFFASDEWLSMWKAIYPTEERRIIGEVEHVSKETVTLWIESHVAFEIWTS